MATASDLETRLASTYRPVVAAIASLAQRLGRSVLVAVSGAQGTGKSTFSRIVAQALASQGLTAAILSIDDVYLTRAEREHLAASVHPLLRTRGVPGTHDLDLANTTLSQLLTLADGAELLVPRFDKGRDDRCPQEQWARYQGPVDVVLLEGWCVGAQALDDAALATPINSLESSEDTNGLWRTYVNTCIRQSYQPLWQRSDAMVMLQAPSFDCVYRWRSQQEEELRASLGAAADAAQGLMDDQQLTRFIQHYERITRALLQQLPDQADALIPLAEDHSIGDIVLRGAFTPCV